MKKITLGFVMTMGAMGCKENPGAGARTNTGTTTRTNAEVGVRAAPRVEVARAGDGTPFVATAGLKCGATIDPNSIPAKPVEGEVNGEKFLPASAGFWAAGSFGGSSLMFRTPLGKEAGCDRFFAETRVEVTIDAVVNSSMGVPLMVAKSAKNANYVVKREDEKPLSSNSELGVYVQVDSIERKRGGKVKGKVAICFKDEKKSWIAGTFEADTCE